MAAQPAFGTSQKTVYSIELESDRMVVTPENAPPPSGAPLEGPPPRAVRAEGAPLFRIDHPLYERETRAAWIVDELLAPGGIFHGKVHVAQNRGGKKPARSKGGAALITSATFTTIIGSMLHQSAYVEGVCLPEELIAEAVLDGPNSLSHQKVEQGGQLLARLFLHYWRAVATAFSDAWDDPHEHLLWHPHGLEAFAKLGALVVQDQVAKYDIRQHYFDEVLERIADSVSLAKTEHAAVPAREKTEHLFQLLAAARHETATRRPTLMAVPGGVSDINWGSAPPPKSPDVGSVPLGPEN